MGCILSSNLEHDGQVKDKAVYRLRAHEEGGKSRTLPRLKSTRFNTTISLVCDSPAKSKKSMSTPSSRNSLSSSPLTRSIVPKFEWTTEIINAKLTNSETEENKESKRKGIVFKGCLYCTTIEMEEKVR